MGNNDGSDFRGLGLGARQTQTLVLSRIWGIPNQEGFNRVFEVTIRGPWVPSKSVNAAAQAVPVLGPGLGRRHPTSITDPKYSPPPNTAALVYTLLRHPPHAPAPPPPAAASKAPSGLAFPLPLGLRNPAGGDLDCPTALSAASLGWIRCNCWNQGQDD